MNLKSNASFDMNPNQLRAPGPERRSVLRGYAFLTRGRAFTGFVLCLTPSRNGSRKTRCGTR